ncbi:MAG: DNA polymerase III subunit gamma/tau [Gemmatimonadaceae bacterium]
MSLALARKYRPRTFQDVAVQGHVAATLQGAIARGRVAHGYLLCGPRGVGKTTLARVLAMALNCENGAPGGEPCGTCPSCTRIWSGSASLDVVEIDAASNRGVDDARELRERAMYAPSGDDRYKVYIVDEAHMLTREAWNALLKILEEPPPRVVFVFATTEPQKIAQAAAPVLSRLQRFDFKRIAAGEIRPRLEYVLGEEGIEADPDALVMISRAADGSMRDALSLADQVLAMGEGRVTTERVRAALGLVPEDEFLGVLDLVAERRAGDVFPLVARLADAGIDFGQFITGLADTLRAQLAVALGGSAPDVSERMREALVQRRDRLPAADLLRMLHALTELEQRFRKSGQQQLLIETLLVRFALLDRTVDLERVLRGIGGGVGGGAEDARSARRDPPRVAPAGGRQASADAPATAPFSPPPMADRAVSAPVQREPAPGPAPQPAAPPPGGREGSVELVERRWDDILNMLRARGRQNLGTALAHARPLSLANGVLGIQLDEPNAHFERAIEQGQQELVEVLGTWMQGVRAVSLVGAAAPAPKRLTGEEVRAERIKALRRQDPVLGAAIDALDLDVAD